MNTDTNPNINPKIIDVFHVIIFKKKRKVLIFKLNETRCLLSLKILRIFFSLFLFLEKTFLWNSKKKNVNK